MSLAAAARRDRLARDLRSRAFAPGPAGGAGARVGVELELLPVDDATGAPLGPDGRRGPSTLELLRAVARERGWATGASADGVPEVRIPGAGRFTFEPGGQIEYASAVRGSVDDVVAEVGAAVRPLRELGRDRGVRLVARGIDPRNPPRAARRVLRTRRYGRLAGHLARRGPAGRRMMLQTAALHVNLDPGPEPDLRWRVANALTPWLLACFANSSRYRGRETGHRSYRGRQWRELDPGRCGVFPGREPVDEYLRFALGAGAILLGEDGEPARPFEAWLGSPAADGDAWEVHLTTLFPEVRPRRYLEIRTPDTIPPRWLAAPLVFLAGILYDDEACRTADALLPPATVGALDRAGRAGVTDRAIRRQVGELWELALEGADRLDGVVGGHALEVARAFRDRYPARGRDLAEDPDGGTLER